MVANGCKMAVLRVRIKIKVPDIPQISSIRQKHQYVLLVLSVNPCIQYLTVEQFVIMSINIYNNQ